MAVMIDETTVLDETYEFSAPRFFDFIDGETEEDMRQAELWFESALSYAPSPFMPKIKTGRSVQIGLLCDFTDESSGDLHKPPESSQTTATVSTVEIKEEVSNPNEEAKVNLKTSSSISDVVIALEKKICEDKSGACTRDDLAEKCTSPVVGVEPLNDKDGAVLSTGQVVVTEAVACTPKPQKISAQIKQTDSKKHETAKKIASIVRNPSVLKERNQSQLSKAKGSIKPTSSRREASLKQTVSGPHFSQENQAIKRQKLEGGRTRQILNVKPQNLTHKSRPGVLSATTSNLCTSNVKSSRKEDRKVYVREQVPPFVSTAEMMKKFQSGTREMSLPCPSRSLSHDGTAASIMNRRPKLTLTRPKEPEFETAQRVRAVRVKSAAEIEEEIMANIPKFKARPINKKILEAPTLPALPRSNPQLPEFQEFHLETMARANQNAETSTVASTESVHNNQWRPHLTAPRTPFLQTSQRARPTRVKSSEEIEKEELEKIPKFKARPLNKKIFESKGALGLVCNTKRQITIPQEFHFATDERIPSASTVADMFDSLSMKSENERQLPRNTMPNPFHLHTEERGAEKERKFFTEIIKKQWEEERARIPRATPYPYTTDYPVIPPKPEPKQLTKPEPFQLESLVRHEEEVQREMEERRRMEMEEAHMRIFKAQPILKDDPLPLPEKSRKPLTEVHEFNLHVDHRAVDRSEFDKKVKEKETMYKRYREEAESERMMEEEKALKQLRRTLVPYARPVPSFDHPFVPVKSSREPTRPKSPKLQVVMRKEKRGFRSAAAATSSAAASSMR